MIIKNKKFILILTVLLGSLFLVLIVFCPCAKKNEISGFNEVGYFIVPDDFKELISFTVTDEKIFLTKKDLKHMPEILVDFTVHDKYNRFAYNLKIYKSGKYLISGDNLQSIYTENHSEEEVVDVVNKLSELHFFDLHSELINWQQKLLHEVSFMHPSEDNKSYVVYSRSGLGQKDNIPSFKLRVFKNSTQTYHAFRLQPTNLNDTYETSIRRLKGYKTIEDILMFLESTFDLKKSGVVFN